MIKFALLTLTLTIPIVDNGQFQNIDPKIRDWFKSVRSPQGVPCCDISDGHLTIWDKKPGNNNYWVPIGGEWKEVPPEAVIYNTANPMGESIVWYVKQAPNTYYIRCFVPSSEG